MKLPDNIQSIINQIYFKYKQNIKFIYHIGYSVLFDNIKNIRDYDILIVTKDTKTKVAIHDELKYNFKTNSIIDAHIWTEDTFIEMAHNEKKVVLAKATFQLGKLNGFLYGKNELPDMDILIKKDEYLELCRQQYQTATPKTLYYIMLIVFIINNSSYILNEEQIIMIQKAHDNKLSNIERINFDKIIKNTK